MHNFSHEQYVRQLRKEKQKIVFWQVMILITFLLVWELASRYHWIDPLLFSSPTKVIVLLYKKLMDQSLLIHIIITLLETIAGFIIGTVLGIFIASVLWYSYRFAQIADPYLVIFNALPKVALGPIIIVAFGPSFLSIIVMGAIISVIITTLVVFGGFNEVDPQYVKVLQSFGATKKQSFLYAIFPATLPAMIATLKVNVGLSWVGVIVGEFLVAKNGLGYLIIYGFQVFDFTLVMMSLFIIAILAAIMYKIVEKLERIIIKHRHV